MPSPKLHTRFVFTPTGPAHIGHVYLARFCKLLADRTGGSFVYRFEDVLAMQSEGHGKAPQFEAPPLGMTGAHYWAEKNIEEMEAIGLAATAPDVLREMGFSPGIRVKRQSGNGLTDWYWELWGCDKIWGNWPAYKPPGKLTNQPDGVYWDKYSMQTLGNCAFAGMPQNEHPYIILNRCVEDLDTGRNCILRGEGLREEAALYSFFAQRILNGSSTEIPRLYYLHELQHDGEAFEWGIGPAPLHQETPGLERGHLKFSSSDRVNTGNYYVRDVLEAGREPEELFHFLDAVCLNGMHAPDLCGLMGGLLPNLPRDPVIKDADWNAFLEKGRIPEP